MKFIKKPIVIDAVQWDGTLNGMRTIEAKLPTLITVALNYSRERGTVQLWRIKTPEGRHVMSAMDWIITGADEKHYPCKPSIFEANYDSCEPTTEPKP